MKNVRMVECGQPYPSLCVLDVLFRFGKLIHYIFLVSWWFFPVAALGICSRVFLA